MAGISNRRMEKKVQNNALRKSILKTIAFFDLFDFPLTADEILEYLYQYRKPVHIKEVRGLLGMLHEAGELEQIKDYYVIKGRGKIIDTRKARKFIAEKFWTRTTLYGQYMRAVPFVRMIAVCNNLAYDNPSEQSDIDLFIVVKPGRMWFARLLITLILQYYGVRRHGSKVTGRFCLSFFVTEEALDVSQFSLKEEDPYLAYWTKFLSPIMGRSVYADYVKVNERFLKKYGLKFSEDQLKHMYLYKPKWSKKFGEWLFGGFLGNAAEWLLKQTLKRKTLKSAKSLGPESSVIVSDQILKFHNHDRRQEYRRKWQERVSLLENELQV